MTMLRSAVWCWLLMPLVGCGAESTYRRAAEYAEPSTAPATPRETSDAAGSVDKPSLVGAPTVEKDVSKRRIVYRVEVDLVVEQFDSITEQLEALVQRHGGFIATSQVVGNPGSPRSGRWTVRVPVDKYPGLLAAVRQLGEVHRSSATSDDVTAEYYDVEARIHNKKQEEERLLKLLSEATGKLEEILAVERELSRVRGEIEQTQGRLRVLRDLTELTTVTVNIAEIRGYVPEQSPTYMTRVRRAFSASTEAFISTVQICSLVAVALTPWLPMPVVLVLLVLAVRRLRRRAHG